MTRRGWRGEAGQAAVELALVLPVLLILLVGMIECARAWNMYQVLTDAAREGARTAILASPLVDDDSVRSVIAGALRRGALDPALATVELSGTDAPSGSATRVEVRYPARMMVFGLAGQGDRSRFELATSAVMRNE